MPEIDSEMDTVDTMDVDTKSESAQHQKEAKITDKPKSYAKLHRKLSKRYSQVIKDSEDQFINYTSLRKEYITLSNKIGSLTDILGLIDRLHQHQTDMSEEKQRLENIISKKPQLKDVITPIIQDEVDPEKLRDLYALTDLSVHLLQDQEVNKTTWADTISHDENKKRRGSIVAEDSVKKRKLAE